MGLTDQTPTIQGATDGTEIGNINSSLRSVDVLTESTGVQGALTVGTSAVAAKVGASNLVNRKLLTIFNNSSNTIYWGFTSGVMTSSGTPIFKNPLLSIAVSDASTVYLIAGSAGNDVRITEGA